MNVSPIVAAAFVAALAGCAHVTPVPADKLARVDTAIRTAEQIDANADPRACAHLALAKEQVAQARGLIRAGQNANAGLVLLRAEADAEAALSLARESLALRAARDTMEAARAAMPLLPRGQQP